MSDDQPAPAAMLLPGWRHPRTGKLHIRADCKAVIYHAQAMRPVLIRVDDLAEVDRVFAGENTCAYCFPVERSVH